MALRFASNSVARFSSVVSVNYENVSDKPAGFPIKVGVSQVLSGTNGDTLYNNNGILGNRPASTPTGDPFIILDSGQSNFQRLVAFNWTAPSNLYWWISTDVSGVPGTTFIQVSSLNPNSNISAPLAHAARIARAKPNQNVYLINVSQSGQTISHWLPGTPAPDVYADIRANVPVALAAIGATKIDLFRWWQGEQDLGIVPATYLTSFATLMGRLRAETWYEWNTPVVINGITSDAISAGLTQCDAMNMILMAVSNVEPDQRLFVYSATLPASYWTGSPAVHMTGPGYALQGEMAANAFLYGTHRKVTPGIITDPATGNVAIGNALVGPDRLNIAGKMNSTGYKQYVTFDQGAVIDVSGGVALAVADNASVILPMLRGLIMISELVSTGDTALYLIGQSGAAMISAVPGSAFVAPTTTPAAGHCSVCWDGVSAYRLYNHVGAVSFVATQLKNS